VAGILRGRAGMKTLLATLALLGLLLGAPRGAGAATRNAPANPFGLGIMVGAPTGLTGKLYLGRPFALQMGIGVVDDFSGDGWDDDALHIHLDAVWHPAILARNPSVTVPFYLGIGARFAEADHVFVVDGVWYEDDHSVFGVRAPFGLLIDFNRVPLDIFFEVAMVVNVVYFEDDGPFEHDHDHVGLNGGVGLRYYF
jgi:hypothetical protein